MYTAIKNKISKLFRPNDDIDDGIMQVSKCLIHKPIQMNLAEMQTIYRRVTSHGRRHFCMTFPKNVFS